MKRRMTAFLLSALLAGAMVVPAGAAEVQRPTVAVTVNGEEAELRGTLYGWTSFLPFDEGIRLFCPEAEISEEDGLYTAKGEGFTLTARAGDCYFVINGRYRYVPQGLPAREEDGMPMLSSVPLCIAMGGTVAWTGQVEFTLGEVPLPAELPYTEEELDLISRVIMHEAGWEPFEGKLAVGSVIMNRVHDGQFPDSVYDVIYQPNQFAGATNATPNEDSIVAARLVLEGANVVPGAFFFNGKGIPCWASQNKAQLYVIGNHAFYG